MRAIGASLDQSRDLLLQAIIEVLQSWPESHRRIFTQAHYQGKNLETIAGSTGLSQPEVQKILLECERKLRGALRIFRDRRSYPAAPAGHNLHEKLRLARSLPGCHCIDDR